MNDQSERYNARRAANTLSDGSRPYAWWKMYQRHVGGAKTVSDRELQRDAARIAKTQTELTGDDQ